MLSKERVFEGKVFIKVDSGFSPMKAKCAAKELKSKGYKVRSIRSSNGDVTLYRRHDPSYFAFMLKGRRK